MSWRRKDAIFDAVCVQWYEPVVLNYRRANQEWQWRNILFTIVQ